LLAQYVLDAHSNGHHDVVHAVQLQSNKLGAAVTQAVVYLVDAASDAGYCYSALASAQLTPRDLRSPAAAAAALRLAKARLGMGAFTCGP
jgi:hypothetical protein